jgi:hypothetical protein
MLQLGPIRNSLGPFFLPGSAGHFFGNSALVDGVVSVYKAVMQFGG